MPQRPMHRRRLRILARYLDTDVTDKAFNTEYWWCGTYGCALGHACMIPEFRQAGLHLTRARGDEVALPQYKDATGASAGQLFFGLTDKQTMNVFLFGGTRQEKIAELRLISARKEKKP